MLTLPTLSDREQNQVSADRAESIRALNHRIRVTNRYIARLLSRRDGLIAERAGLLMAAERDAVRELAGIAGQNELPVVQLRDERDEEPERWDGLS